MAKSDAFPQTFRTLRGLLEKHRGRMMVVADTPVDYSIASPDMVDRSGRPVFVAAVQIKKSYVSFHLMPVYMNPALLESLSPALRKRMQGKSCFNFVTIEPADARELSAVTRKGIAGFKDLKLPWARPV
ncbi:MAG: hypothetical protein ABIX28_04410 [Vicinamibacterales bacterium]